jgi:hypothetical protein
MIYEKLLKDNLIKKEKPDFKQIAYQLKRAQKDLKTAKASLSYTPKNLTARYESNTTLTTKIDTVPITLDFDLPSKVEKGNQNRNPK